MYRQKFVVHTRAIPFQCSIQFSLFKYRRMVRITSVKGGAFLVSIIVTMECTQYYHVITVIIILIAWYILA